MSGGVDSVLLLYQLCTLSKKRDDLKVSAIVVDEGIRGYSKEVMRFAEKAAELAGIALYQLSYKDMFGMTLDDFMRKLKGRDLDTCAVCLSLRRAAFERKADEIGVDRVALPVNMDDEAQGIISGYFCGDDGAGVVVRSFVQKKADIHIIMPLSRVLGNEAVLYAKLKGFDALSLECPHACGSVRLKIRGVLDELEERHPGIKFNVVNARVKAL